MNRGGVGNSTVYVSSIKSFSYGDCTMTSILKVNTIQHTGGTTGLTIDSSGVVTQPV